MCLWRIGGWLAFKVGLILLYFAKLIVMLSEQHCPTDLLHFSVGF